VLCEDTLKCSRWSGRCDLEGRFF